MFHEGSLQQGISTAVGQQKLVLCFVTDENEESQTWENEFLQDSLVKDVITKQAIALRLIAGSEEAGYLSQIFPLPQVPTIVVMKHGELKEYIAAGTTKDQFTRRILNSFNVPLQAAPTPSPPETGSAAPTTLSTSAGVPPTGEQSASVRRVLQERAQRQEEAKRAAEKQSQDQLEKTKAQADEEVSKSTQKQAELLKKKRQQESDERKRILKRIQDDKDERRKQAQQRLEQRRRQSSASDSHAKDPSLSPVGAGSLSGQSSQDKRRGEFTSIQVRLFDGSTMRSKFKTSSLVAEIRKWVDENRTDGNVPFAFKHLLTPLPNRPVEETEEDKPIGDLGLAPSSTLILVPTRNYATAYSHSSQGFFAYLTHLLIGFFASIFGFLGLAGGVRTNDQGADTTVQDGSSAAETNKKAAQGARKPSQGPRDQQLYNGNSLNFEPRPDEEEKP